MRRIPILSFVFTFLLTMAASATADDTPCAVAKLKASKRYAACHLRAEKAAARSDETPDYESCEAKLARGFARAATYCSGLDSPLVEGDVASAIGIVSAAIGRAARSGEAPSLGEFCGAGTFWSASAFSCVTDGGPIGTGVSAFSLPQMVDGQLIERRVQVHAPDTLEPGRSYPVVFAFHGNGGTGDPFVQRYASWVNAGEFIGVYPDGIANSWNLGREASQADDVEFVEAIVAELSRRSEVDVDRLFAVGFSNGAGMVHRLAGQTDLFRGIGAVATALLEGDAPAPDSKSVRVIQVLGVEDPLIPYGGGIGVLGHDFLSAEESAAAWAGANSCVAPMTEGITSQGNIKLEYDGCADGGRVVSYGIIGEGHNVPRDTEGGLDALIFEVFEF